MHDGVKPGRCLRAYAAVEEVDAHLAGLYLSFLADTGRDHPDIMELQGAEDAVSAAAELSRSLRALHCDLKEFIYKAYYG